MSAPHVHHKFCGHKESRCILQVHAEHGIELIECNDEEYDYLGSNVLCIEPGKCITIDGNPDIVQKMRDAGVEVTTYEGRELSYKGTGGPTCLTCPITRL